MPTSAVSALDPDEYLTPAEDEYLKPAEVAEIAKLSESTLKDKRRKGTGPRFIKLSPGRGGRIRYRRSDVLAWLAGDQKASVV